MRKWFTIPFSTFYQNSVPWSVSLGWPYMVWLIVSLNQTRLWSMWSVWLFIVDHPEFPAQVLTRLPSGYQWGVFLSGSQDPLPSLWGCQQNSVPCSYKAEGPSFFLVVTGVLSWAFSQHWLLETTKSILINPRVRDVRYHVKSYKKNNGEHKSFDVCWYYLLLVSWASFMRPRCCLYLKISWLFERQHEEISIPRNKNLAQRISHLDTPPETTPPSSLKEESVLQNVVWKEIVNLKAFNNCKVICSCEILSVSPRFIV